MLHDTDRQGMFVRGSPMPTAASQTAARMAPLFEKMENQMLIVGHTDSLQYTTSDSEQLLQLEPVGSTARWPRAPSC
jgi:flagellar motor protein MotB